ncbi:MAG: hypothetical protein Q8L77_07425 [Nitrospirota bacterium]|nr:hypothetical protein [Nitrospirota bacterium]
MKRQRWIIPVFVWSLAFGMPLAAWAEISPVFVELSQAVHFLDTQGQDLVATSGTYRVEAHETWLTLIPADGKSALQLATTAGTHEEVLTAPLALSIPLGTDEHHLVWLQPGGATLDAKGSPSGIQSRGPALVSATALKKYASATSVVGTMVPTKPCSVSARPANILAAQPVPSTHYITISPLTLASSLLFENMKTSTGAPITAIATDEHSNILGTILTLTAPSGTYATRLAAPLQIPDGAVIREMSVLVYDSLDEDVQVGLLSHRLSLGASSMGMLPPGDSLLDVYIKSDCASAIRATLMTVGNLAIPVVNRDRGYLVYVFMTAKPTPGQKISPIRIGYTLP